jgi:chemotaxis protein MotB
VCATLLLGALAGCVTASRHDQLTAERNELEAAKLGLEEQVRLLQIANESLDEQVAELKDRREDVLVERDDLSERLDTTVASEADLREQLRSREEELSLTASALIAQSQKVNEFQTTYDALIGDLEEELAAGEVRIEQLRDGLQMEVSQDILFPSGSAALSPAGTAVLQKMAERLVTLPYVISVEGHTDSIPIRGRLAKRYPTNWELAGSRAARVVRLFVDAGVDAAKLTAVSHASYHPVADEDTEEGRASNRRIEIRLRPDPEADASTPEW